MAGGQITKSQHYVPRTYLKHLGYEVKPDKFRIDRVAKESLSENDITSHTLEEVCAQNHWYTLDGSTIDEKMALEDYYNETAESGYNVLWDRLTNQESEDISGEQLELLIHVVTTMLMRTPKALEAHYATLDRTVETLYNMCQQMRSETFRYEDKEGKEFSFNVSGKSLLEMQREVKKALRQEKALDQLAKALNLSSIRGNQLAVMIVTIDADAGTYITSDHPVRIMSMDGIDVALNPKASLRLPISPKDTLWLMPLTDSPAADILRTRITRVLQRGDDAKAERISANTYQYDGAERWLLGSREELARNMHERVILAKHTSESIPQSSEESKKKLKEWGLI
jgi:hypothetical protein